MGYCRNLKKVSLGKGTINRTGKCTAMQRRFQRLVGYAEWYKVRDANIADEVEYESNTTSKAQFRNKQERRYIEGVVHVQHTPGSALKNQLTKMERGLKFKNRMRNWRA